MGLINTLKSFRKSWELRKISKSLSKRDSDEERYLDDLVSLIYSEEYIADFLFESGFSQKTLKDIYYKLDANGAGQYADGHFVSASSLVYGQTLLFILDHYIDGKFFIKDYDEYNSTIFITNRLVEYFNNKETGPVIFN